MVARYLVATLVYELVALPFATEYSTAVCAPGPAAGDQPSGGGAPSIGMPASYSPKAPQTDEAPAIASAPRAEECAPVARASAVRFSTKLEDAITHALGTLSIG